MCIGLVVANEKDEKAGAAACARCRCVRREEEEAAASGGGGDEIVRREREILKCE